MLNLYDTHAHLDDAVFRPDLPALLERARNAGVTRILSVGTDAVSSRDALQLAEAHESVYAAVGWHPNHAAQAPTDIRSDLREWARHPKVVALGETGLDYHYLPGTRGGSSAEDTAEKERQIDLFTQHLEVARECGLPCVIHQRDSLADVFHVFTPFAPNVRGQFHCFVDGPDVLRRVVELGSVVSFTGILTYKTADLARAALAAAPPGSFMLETDSPYLAPVPYRRQRCEPAYVRETAQLAAQIRGVDLETLGAITCQTAHTFFPKLAPPPACR